MTTVNTITNPDFTAFRESEEGTEAIRQLESMLLIRIFEDKSASLQAAGQSPSMCTSVGQEAGQEAGSRAGSLSPQNGAAAQLCCAADANRCYDVRRLTAAWAVRAAERCAIRQLATAWV